MQFRRIECSDLVDTAVDGNVGAGGEAAQVRRQEHHRVGNLLGLAVARQRDDAALVVLELLLRVRSWESHPCERVDAWSIGGAWADHVDPNLAVPQLTCPGAGQRAQRRLDGPVNAD